MVFSSSLFLYFFLPGFLLAYYASPPRWRNVVIITASLLFYTVGAGVFIAALLLSVVGNHFLAKRMEHPSCQRRGSWLACGVILNLLALLYYKYIIFLWPLLDSVFHAVTGNSLGTSPAVTLPIGISFFTFQALSYLIDIYRRDVPAAKSYFDFAVYHTLFPQLVAGPIVRFREVREQLHTRRVILSQLSEGAFRFCMGFGKKIILADNLAFVVDEIMKLPAHELTCGYAWLGMLCYSFQIYYDFSGYSDMAIGLGKMMGFNFPENFDQPYRAANITEFWRRWHMTLTRWFKDYLYIPMGGNRHGTLRTCLNLATVFILCGLWHGASLNFLIWGIYHGCLLSIERVLERTLGWRPRGIPGTALTFILVMIGWVFFRIETMDAAIAYLSIMSGFGVADSFYFSPQHFLTPDIVCYLAAACIFAFIPISQSLELVQKTRAYKQRIVFAVGVFCLAAFQLAANSFNPFIYFRF